ncbi:MULTISPECIES: hypothetical protein [unclassified Vibrio]|uniref:hypothetical protein n=1 Tax=unclassified Vibrio TaxID=2614977 RepID=UPI000C84BD53|nr:MULTISPECIES: hypothetical protein [unclassified Vibrio]PMI19255.1 hypothetical protein BCU50_19620 [Vibrio sp. 10N.286.46.E10]PMI87715.1 hypothetical protein BCU34_05100 [Vibrio sp. 10N.286.45.E10]PTP08386.1 hypothetical protein CWO17_06240 [Vibrio sp. 10N.286.45.A3]PTQ24855.1 hypothetical protein CWO24_06420 [Vibrio sp. 10N.286.46.E10]TKE85761.1 hypothetical protein FCV56_07395 [Vibrio sp. F12]
MAKNFKGSPRSRLFLETLPQDSIKDSNIENRCKFNFSYLTIKDGSQSFEDWNQCAGNSKLVKLMDKIKDFTKESLLHWEREKVGKGRRGGKGKRQHYLEVYGEFPKKSAFKHPAHVPENVSWARFRIDCDTRLAGFVISQEIANECRKQGKNLDANTFYVVFLDEDHQFYQT